MHKTIIISGASSGFGLAMAKQLYAEGHTLILGARRLQRLKDFQASLSDAKRCLIHALDVQNTSSVNTFKLFVLEHKLTVHALLNNAGLALGKDTLELSQEDDLMTMLNTNVAGIFRMCQSFIPLLKETPFSQIINVGSIAGQEAYAKGAGYCASKFAVKALTQALRQELLNDHIRVGSIDPGLANTEFSQVRHKGDQTLADATYHDLSPLMAEDIAQAVSFMLSRPAHVNIDQMIIMPSQQANAHQVNRSGRIKSQKN